MSRRGAGFPVPDCRHVCSRGWLLSVLNHAVRCFVIARAPCLLLSPPHPPPHRVRSVCGCFGCGVSDGCRVAGLDFGELRAGLSSSYVTELLFVVAADHSVRCFVVAHALCLLP